MTFAPRRRAARTLAALAVLVALAAPLALAGTALAQTSSITQQDCDQGTIRDKSGQAISKARCQQLIGKQVQLASTGFDVWPLVAGGCVLLAGAALLGFRRSSPVRPS
jgi:LPXTG-motif cell wall-anchored protein